MSGLKRYNIKAIYSDPKLKRHLITRGTASLMHMSGADVTLEQAEQSYDELQQSKCKECKGTKGSYDQRKVWRRCPVCKGTGRKKTL